MLLKQLHRGATVPPELVDQLIVIVQDDSVPEATRQQVAVALGRLGLNARKAVPVLVRMYQNSEHLPRRLWLLKSFSRFGSTAPELAPVAIATLQKSGVDPLERMSCLDVLSQIGTAHRDTLPTLIKLIGIRPEKTLHLTASERERELVLAIESVAFLGPSAAASLPRLIELTRSDVEAVRRSAAAAIGQMGPEAELAISALVDLIVADASEAVRDSAAESLVACGTRVVQVVGALLEEEDAEVRRRAARIVGQMSEEDADQCRGELLTALADHAPEVVLEACRSLARFNGNTTQVLRTSMRLIQSDNRQVRIGAVRLLKELGPVVESERDALELLAQHANPVVRQAARQVLRNLKEPKAERQPPSVRPVLQR